MLATKRQGFTLMEIVLVMVLIAILATGVAIGFTSYINRGHETGITTDFNSTFKNPIRMTAIEKGKVPRMSDLKATVLADGFSTYDTTTDWQEAVVDSNDTALAANTVGSVFGVVKGNKRYEVIVTTYDIDAAGTEYSEQSAIMVRADHSSKNSTAVYVLNESKNDVVTIVGTLSNADDFTTFVPDEQ